MYDDDLDNHAHSYVGGGVGNQGHLGTGNIVAVRR
jgi:hypothetical protein